MYYEPVTIQWLKVLVDAYLNVDQQDCPEQRQLFLEMKKRILKSYHKFIHLSFDNSKHVNPQASTLSDFAFDYHQNFLALPV